jgi:hypothetical protein
MIRFTCPRCKSVLSAPGNRGGTKTHCPKCQQRLQVPMPPANKTILPPLMEHRPTTLQGPGQASVWLKPALIVAGAVLASKRTINKVILSYHHHLTSTGAFHGEAS